MNLARQQTALLSLLKTGHAENDDVYIQSVAISAHLRMLREIILAWRRYDIQRHCPLTATLLKKCARFEELVSSFAAAPNLSPFPDQMAEAFLCQMSEQEDPIITCIAQFELFMTRVKLGDPGEYTVNWPADPRTVIACVLQETPLSSLTLGEHFCMRISRRFEGLVQLSALESNPAG